MKIYRVVETSLGASGARVTIKEVNEDLHNRIIFKHGSYKEMQEDSEINYDDSLMEEFLNCPNVEIFETFQGKNE